MTDMNRNCFSLWIAGCLLLLASCADSGRYVDALPDDASAVMAVNLAQTLDKSGAEDKAAQSVADALKGELPDAGGLIDRIVDDPSESGLELKDKVYVFASSQGSVAGVLARVSDSGKVDRLLEELQKQQLCAEPVESDGCVWTVVGGKALAAYTDGAFLLVAETDGRNPEGLQHRASMWLRQKEGEGFAACPDFAKLKDSGKDLAAILSLDLLPRGYMAPLTMGVSADLRLEDVKSFVTLNFETGKAVLEAEAMVADKLVGELMDRQLEATGPVQGSYLDLFPANTGLWMAGNLDGAKVYSLLCENPTARQQLENSMIPVDFRRIFHSIQGDMVFAMPDPLASPGFIAYADVTDSRFLQTFEELRPLLALTGGTMKLMNVGADEYEFRMADASVLGSGTGALSFWFGVRDGRFYFTNDLSLRDSRVSGLTLRDNKWGKEVKGKRFFMAVNLDAAGEAAGRSGMMRGLPFMGPAARLSDYLTLESADGKSMRMEWVMKDSKENALKQLLSF